MFDLNGLCQSIYPADGRQLEPALVFLLVYLTESERNRRQTLCLDELEEAAAGFEYSGIEANNTVDGKAGMDQPQLLSELNVGDVKSALVVGHGHLTFRFRRARLLARRLQPRVGRHNVPTGYHQSGQ